MIIHGLALIGLQNIEPEHGLKLHYEVTDCHRSKMFT